MPDLNETCVCGTDLVVMHGGVTICRHCDEPGDCNRSTCLNCEALYRQAPAGTRVSDRYVCAVCGVRWVVPSLAQACEAKHRPQ